MLTPEPGQDVVITIRGTVRRLGAHGLAALVRRTDGVDQWIALPDLTGAIEWEARP
ncbi:MAG: hypothetical protein NVV70_17040 [Cellulomonas sp.]|nr:hypothetical protein [Cellulomonas sp.]MCR6649753.1 hypothetical protein [Cellulomonas sp.]